MAINDIIKTAIDSKNFMKNLKNYSDEVYGTGITQTDNEIKDIIKVIKSLENRVILLKEATIKITSQERGCLNFLKPLMTAGLAKSVFLPVGLSAGMSATDAAIQKSIYGSGTIALIISNEEIEDIKRIESLEESG